MANGWVMTVARALEAIRDDGELLDLDRSWTPHMLFEAMWRTQVVHTGEDGRIPKMSAVLKALVVTVPIARVTTALQGNVVNEGNTYRFIAGAETDFEVWAATTMLALDDKK